VIEPAQTVDVWDNSGHSNRLGARLVIEPAQTVDVLGRMSLHSHIDLAFVIESAQTVDVWDQVLGIGPVDVAAGDRACPNG
jgi:hypothetical protein